ncbi:Mediator of RNA polymerase II transcription subunit 6 [Lecanosticta acicola]|uniref:Mediator of RNA polymerase II transcription subunit 6 n=1 Tax=Lecanosticta acicola TaxID=111012 RepID=A0AAI8Z552_9PEZI|nr:Mediator of RNA polymerase II transcription subunit 6 [Lecanosticta acicola]
MAKMTSEPLDEIQHRRPEIIEWWVSQGGRPMDENMIHRYLSESAFFDWESKNGIIFQQAKANVEQWMLTCDRKALEDVVRDRPGTEYIITGEPRPVEDKALAAQGMTTGIWTIRKQNRVLKELAKNPTMTSPGPSVLTEPHKRSRNHYWELTVLGTFFAVGECVYQAPNVFDVVGNRLLAAAASLNTYFGTAGSLPRYTPAAGHHYLPRALKQTTSTSSTASPGGGTLMPGSREGSVAPDGELQSIRAGSVDSDTRQASSSAAASNSRDTQLLIETLNLMSNYGDEFADENPLIGEPGNLRFTTSTAAVKKRRADDEAAEAKARAEKESASASQAPTPKPEKAAPTPPAVFSETKATKAEKLKEERRGSKASKKERKKSRAHNSGTATSPTTPASATSTQAPNSALS